MRRSPLVSREVTLANRAAHPTFASISGLHRTARRGLAHDVWAEPNSFWLRAAPSGAAYRVADLSPGCRRPVGHGIEEVSQSPSVGWARTSDCVPLGPTHLQTPLLEANEMTKITSGAYLQPLQSGGPNEAVQGPGAHCRVRSGGHLRARTQSGCAITTAPPRHRGAHGLRRRRQRLRSRSSARTRPQLARETALFAGDSGRRVQFGGRRRRSSRAPRPRPTGSGRSSTRPAVASATSPTRSSAPPARSPRSGRASSTRTGSSPTIRADP